VRLDYCLHVLGSRLRGREPLSLHSYLQPRLYGDFLPDGAASFPEELCSALQRELDRHEGDLVVDRLLVARGDRSAQVLPAAEVRAFGLSLWAEGIEHVKGWADELGEVADAIADWMGPDRPGLDAMTQAHPFLKANDFARHYAEGTAIDEMWRRYQSMQRGHWMQPMAAAAAARPGLRALYPYTSLRLCFSRWVGYPFSYDLPHVEICIPPPLVYRVYRAAPLRDHSEDPEALVGEFDDPEQAADLLETLLPDAPVLYRQPLDE
jgi:hypothetical protein